MPCQATSEDSEALGGTHTLCVEGDGEGRRAGL